MRYRGDAGEMQGRCRCVPVLPSAMLMSSGVERFERGHPVAADATGHAPGEMGGRYRGDIIGEI